MRFTLFNLIVVNTMIATCLGLILGDESRIRKNAAQRENDIQFIVKSASWRKLPSDHEAYKKMDHSMLFYCE